MNEPNPPNEQVYRFDRSPSTKGAMIVLNLCHTQPMNPSNPSDILELEHLAEYLKFEYIYYTPSDIGGREAKKPRVEEFLRKIGEDNRLSCIMLVLLANSENAISGPDFTFFDSSADRLDVDLRFIVRPFITRVFFDDLVENNVPKIIVVHAPRKVREQEGSTIMSSTFDRVVRHIDLESDIFLCVSRPSHYTAFIDDEEKASHFLLYLRRIIMEFPSVNFQEQMMMLKRETRHHSESCIEELGLSFVETDLHTEHSLTKTLYLV